MNVRVSMSHFFENGIKLSVTVPDSTVEEVQDSIRKAIKKRVPLQLDSMLIPFDIAAMSVFKVTNTYHKLGI